MKLNMSCYNIKKYVLFFLLTTSIIIVNGNWAYAGDPKDDDDSDTESLIIKNGVDNEWNNWLSRGSEDESEDEYDPTQVIEV